MSTPWPQHRSAFALALLLPWLPASSPSPPEDKPPTVAVEAGVAGASQTGATATKEPLVLSGVVIEEIPKGSALEKAGLQVGDVILSWERLPNPPANPEAASERIDTPFDWMWLEIEQAPRGVVRLTGERGRKRMLFEVPVGAWNGKVSLNLSGSTNASIFNGCDDSASQEHVSQAELKSRVVLCTWNRLKTASELFDAGHRPEAESLLATPLSPALSPSLIALSHLYEGQLYKLHGDVDLAQQAFTIGLQHANQDELLACLFHFYLGYVELNRSNLLLAQDHYSRAIQQLEKLAPRSLELARNLRDLGVAQEGLGRYNEALELLNRSLDLATSISQASWDVATIQNDIGVIHYERGDLLSAEDMFKAAAKLKKELRPNDTSLAGAYSNIGLVGADLGDYEAAEQYYREALRILEVSRDTGTIPREALQAVLVNLGNVLISQKNFEAAELYLNQAKHLFDHEARDTLNYALLLKNLGTLAWHKEHFKKARNYYEEALEIWEKKSPDGPGVASCLEGLGAIELHQNKFAASEGHLKAALQYREKINPGSLATANTLNNLGNLENQRGRYEQAKAYWLRSLALRSKLVPGSELEAKLLFALGEEAFREGNLNDSMNKLNQSIESMERQFDQLDDDDLSGGRYRFTKSDIYRLAAKVAIARGDDRAAFLLSEKYRARGFLNFFAGRSMRFYPDLPEKIDLDRQRVAVLLRKNESALEQFSPGSDPGRVEGLLAERKKLTAVHDANDLAFREAAPRLASLERPNPLDAHDAAKALDAGTALISYFSCGDEMYAMFIGNEKGQEIYRLLHLGRVPGRQVSILVHALTATTSSRTLEKSRARQISEMSGLLYRLLFAPLESLAAPYSRLLIIPDGPLQYLPWGALIREYEKDGLKKRQYLAEWKPLHIALSATVFAELKKDRRSEGWAVHGPPVPDFVAFGDPPVHPATLGKDELETMADIRVRAAVERGLFDLLKPLPWSRREVESIAALFPPGHAKVFIGPEATEEEARKVGKGVRILHFATHAQLDNRSPLNSALALAMPEGFPEGRENGLLQVWEIFEKVRLDADLVVLSACDTALGEDQGGEGLIGLTRAFQYAGARTVIASLWSVRDQATSELMIRFYKHLRAGLTKDEALRQAQIELIHGPIEVVNEKGEKTLLDATAPYFWAGFQLYGDWQ